MALSDEEKAQLEALQKKASEPDDDDGFEIEIWDETGRGAKVPYAKGRSWLQRTFGIDVDPVPDDEGQGDKPPKPGKTAPAKDGNVTHAQRYFGKKTA